MVYFQSTFSKNYIVRQYVMMYYSAFGKIKNHTYAKVGTSYPSGSSYLIFVFENNSVGIEDEKNVHIFEPKVFLKTSLSQPTDLCFCKNNPNFFIVRMYPHAIFSLLGIEPEIFNNQFQIDVNLIKQPWIIEAHKKMSTLNSHKERMEVFEQDLLKHIYKNDICFDPTIEYILYKNDFLKLKDLSQTINFSERYIQKYVKANTGITYTTYRNLRQFQLAYQLMMCSLENEHSINFSKIATLAHYTDQAHMINSFKKISLHTPKKLLKKEKISIIPNIHYFNGIIK